MIATALEGVGWFLAAVPTLVVMYLAVVVYGGLAARLLRRKGRLRGQERSPTAVSLSSLGSGLCSG
jgi:hypothetical protein